MVVKGEWLYLNVMIGQEGSNKVFKGNGVRGLNGRNKRKGFD